MSISVVATVSAKPEFRNHVLEVLSSALEPTRGELGCRKYELHVDRDYPDSFVMIECWDNDAALELHMKTPHFSALLAALDGKVADIDIARLDPVS